jgi:micrococcal nuclease
MRIKTTILTAVFLLLLPFSLFAWEGKVVSVTDGDTIKALKAGKQVKIRLAAIDTPEKGQPYGQAAKKFTANLVTGR